MTQKMELAKKILNEILHEELGRGKWRDHHPAAYEDLILRSDEIEGSIYRVILRHSGGSL